MKRNLNFSFLLAGLLAIAVLAIGCSSEQPVPAPEPTLVAAVASEPTPVPTNAPEPTIIEVHTPGFDVSIWAPVAGFLEQQTMQQNADVLDEVNFFWYTLGADGGIDGGIMAAEAVRVAREAGLRIVPSILNGGFDAQRVSDVVNDPTRRAQHIADILALVRDNGFDGIDIDYESLNPADRDAFSLFIEELAAALHAEGKLLSIAVHAKTDDAGAWSGAAAQDWARLGAAVDEFKIMTYDFHNGASEAGPIAPLDWVDAVLNYAATVVPPAKTWMGAPFYGYDWTGSTADSLNWRQALKLAEQNGAEIQRDPASAEAWFIYGDGSRIAYFNDAATLAARIDIIRNSHPNIAGIAIWPLGGEDPANWPTLRAAINAGQP